jgi:hypothetical protein
MEACHAIRKARKSIQITTRVKHETELVFIDDFKQCCFSLFCTKQRKDIVGETSCKKIPPVVEAGGIHL